MSEYLSQNMARGRGHSTYTSAPQGSAVRAGTVKSTTALSSTSTKNSPPSSGKKDRK